MISTSKQIILWKKKKSVHSIIINIRYLLDIAIIIKIYRITYKKKILLNYTIYYSLILLLLYYDLFKALIKYFKLTERK